MEPNLRAQESRPPHSNSWANAEDWLFPLNHLLASPSELHVSTQGAQCSGREPTYDT